MPEQLTLSDVANKGRREGFGVRIIGGRTIYPAWGWMYRSKSRNGCYVASVPYDGEWNWNTHEKSRRYLPDDTLVELVPLPTETPDNA